MTRLGEPAVIIAISTNGGYSALNHGKIADLLDPASGARDLSPKSDPKSPFGFGPACANTCRPSETP